MGNIQRRDFLRGTSIAAAAALLIEEGNEERPPNQGGQHTDGQISALNNCPGQQIGNR